MAIQLNNISKSFGQIQALENITLQTSDAEIFGIIGPDGAGKTTLFRILVSLLLADEGSASVRGYDVREQYKEIRKIIGYMPGRFSLYQDLSVRENMEFYATVFGTTIEENYDLVKDIYSHIEPFEKRRAGKLSGGMKQKLALSCALIHRPEVLILDEPTTGVDAVSRKEFWDMLKNIQKEGITILVSTPYMDEAELCDRVGLMQDGKLLTVSDPKELTMPEDVQLFNFRCDENIYHYLNRIRDVDERIAAWLFGDEIHVYAEGDGIIEKLTKTIHTWDVKGLDWKELKPGVEDYFMRIMSKEHQTLNTQR